MTLIKYLILSLSLFTMMANAIVIRHDVSDKNYDATPADFPALATLYRIGVHGTLIHPQWVVTAAHAVFCMNPGQKIKVGDQVVAIANRYSYPKYQLGGEHDIALIKLESSITNITPAQLYQGDAEKDLVTWFIGVGGTGTGIEGETINYKENNGKLRKAQNRIIDTTDTDIVFKFEKGANGEALEGVSGNGDSGGPAFIKTADNYQLLGISSRTDSDFYDVGEYGVTELYTRVSSYRDWIQQVISAESDSMRDSLSTQNPFLQDSMKSMDMNELCASIQVN